MVRAFKVFLIFCVAGFALSAGAQYVQQCVNASKSSNDKCDAAVLKVNAADATQATGALGKIDGASNVNMGSNAQSAQIDAQIARVREALAVCASAKSECVGKCDKAKSQAQSSQATRPQAPNVDKAKRSKCEEPLGTKISKLNGDLAQLEQDKAGTDKTKEESKRSDQQPQQQQGAGSGSSADSGGGSSGSSSSSGGGTSKKDEKYSCASADAHRYSDCNSDLVSRCGGSSSSSECSLFTARYCNLGGVNSLASEAVSTAPTSGQLTPYKSQLLLVDKKGEGMGSDFCTSANNRSFCAQAGNANCPSCQSGGAGASTGAQLKQASQTCPGDPTFMDPTTQAKIAAEDKTATGAQPRSVTGAKAATTGAAAAGIGGGSGSAAGAASGVAPDGSTLATGEAASEGMPKGINMGVDGGGGGGYSGPGGGSTFDMDEGSLKPGAFKPGGKAVAGQTLSAAAAKEVSQQYGPNVFAISTNVIKSMCSQRRLNNCP
ncbi:MAG TPA: hypothetical protein PKC28_01620 [Bdellovibrionales bacterium]|nr:hypothetical protein [Bdellovibrionales bacterium]